MQPLEPRYVAWAFGLMLVLGLLLHACGDVGSGCYYHVDADEQCEHEGW